MPRSSNGLEEAILIVEVLKRIPRNRKISINELKNSLADEGYDISVRTLQRYLKAISENEYFGIDCDQRERPYGYRRSAIDSGMSDVTLSASESLLLRLAQEQMRYQMPKKLTESLSYLFNAANDVLDETRLTVKNEKELSWLKKVAVVPTGLPQLAPEIKPRIFDAISDALFRNVKLDILYLDEKKKHRVSPLGLVQQGSRLYLVCQFDGYDNVRHLALHRMKSAKVAEMPSERPKSFSLKNYINERHFNFTNGEKVRWQVEFTSEVTARNLEETPFNKTQKLTKLKDGHYLLDVIIEDSIWLDGWVAAFKDIAGIVKTSKERLGD